MSDVREELGVLGELISHVDQVINLKSCEVMKSLAIRYLIIEIGSVLKVFCRSFTGQGDFSECLEKVAVFIGKDKSELIDEILRLRDLLIQGGDVKEEYIEKLLKMVGDLYVALERALLNK